jgi:hypothetical protein
MLFADPESVCVNCGRPARYSNANGAWLVCSVECADEYYERT